MRDGGGQGGLAVVHVANGANVAVGLLRGASGVGVRAVGPSVQAGMGPARTSPAPRRAFRSKAAMKRAGAGAFTPRITRVRLFRAAARWASMVFFWCLALREADVLT